MKMKYVTYVVLAMSVMACAHRHHAKRQVASVNGSAAATATAKGVMEARVEWIKDKKNKFDFALTLRNETEQGLIVYLNDIACTKGNVTGEVKHTFFNTGERTIDFRPGQTKQFKLVCRLYSEIDSNKFSVSIRRISQNINNDGRSVGKTLYKNLSVPVTL